MHRHCYHTCLWGIGTVPGNCVRSAAGLLCSSGQRRGVLQRSHGIGQLGEYEQESKTGSEPPVLWCARCASLCVCQPALHSCWESVLLSCSNSASWPSRLRCRIPVAQQEQESNTGSNSARRKTQAAPRPRWKQTNRNLEAKSRALSKQTHQRQNEGQGRRPLPITDPS